MRTSATNLAEKIHKLEKQSNLKRIFELANNLNISIGEIVEYASTMGTGNTTANRLREINQTRKQARQRLAAHNRSTELARKARVAKRAKLIETATELKLANKEPELNITVDLDVEDATT